MNITTIESISKVKTLNVYIIKIFSKIGYSVGMTIITGKGCNSANIDKTKQYLSSFSKRKIAIFLNRFLHNLKHTFQ